MAPLTSVEASLQQLISRLYTLADFIGSALQDLEHATSLHRQATRRTPETFGAPPTLLRSQAYYDEEDWSQTNDEAPHTQPDQHEEEGHDDECGC